MDTRTASEQRRAVEHCGPARRMTDEEIRRLSGLSILSPTSINVRNRRCVVARDPVPQRLRAAAYDWF